MTSDTKSIPITIRKLVKTYGPYRALDTLDLDIAGGEFLTLLGPSGSGKSTLLMAIAGFLRADSGAQYGLCQIYGNEPWHYELRRDASDHGCPPMYADPTQDPRMQQ